METFKTLGDAKSKSMPKPKGYGGESVKVGKGEFTPAKTKGVRGALGKSYRKGHNAGHD
jgi:hypothetical protein